MFRQQEKDDRTFRFLRMLNVSRQHQDDCRLIDTSVLILYYLAWFRDTLYLKLHSAMVYSGVLSRNLRSALQLQRLSVAHVLTNDI
jgi:hypothetical protein